MSLCPARPWPVSARLALVIFGAGAMLAGAAAAQPGDAPRYETLVTGQQTQTSGLSVEEIDRQELLERGARSAADALEQVPALYATSGVRGERIFTLRGFTQLETAVLVDGVPLSLPYDGQLDLSLIPAALLDRVIIIKGPASIIYGPNGLGGSVNLITRRPGNVPFAQLSLEGGPLGAFRFDTVHGLALGRVEYVVYASANRREGFPLAAGSAPGEAGEPRENSDRMFWQAGGSVRVAATRRQELRGSVLFIDGKRGVSPSLADPTPRFWRFNVWRGLVATLAHEGRHTAGWSTDEVVYYQKYDNLLDAYDNASYATQESARAMHSWYHDWVVGGRLRSELKLVPPRLRALWLRAWLSVEHDRHDDVPASGGPTTTYSRTLITVAPELEIQPWRRWSFTAAGQFDVEAPGQVPAVKANPTWDAGPLVSARYGTRDRLLVRLTVARRTRFPSLKERFSYGLGARDPNPDLAPESAWHFGLDASWRPLRWLSLEASAFDAEVDDIIDAVRLDNGNDQLQNLGRARLAGVEAAVRLQPWRWLDLQAGYAWLYAKRLGASGARLQYRPAHRATVTLGLTPARWIGFFAFVRVVGPQDYQHPLTRVWGELKAFATLDVTLEFRPTAWLRTWTRASNLLDASYQTEYGFPDPGRAFWMGMELTLDRPSAASHG